MKKDSGVLLQGVDEGSKANSCNRRQFVKACNQLQSRTAVPETDCTNATSKRWWNL